MTLIASKITTLCSLERNGNRTLALRILVNQKGSLLASVWVFRDRRTQFVGALAPFIQDGSYLAFTFSFFSVTATAGNGGFAEGSSSRVWDKLQ